MPNGEENGGLNVPVNENKNVDRALRDLLMAISASPEGVADFQLNLNISSSATSHAPSPSLDYASGTYLRRVLLDLANPTANQILVTFVPDDPQGQINSDSLPHPNPPDKNTWMVLLNDPQNIDIDQGTVLLRMDSAAENFALSWIPNDVNQVPLHFPRSISDTNAAGQPTSDFGKFQECMATNAALSAPSRLTFCLPRLLL